METVRLIIKVVEVANPLAVQWVTVDVQDERLADQLSWANGISASVVGSEVIKEKTSAN